MANTEHLFFGPDFDSTSKEPINFLETRLADLSPFSAHEIEIDGEVFKTVEHAYHALRIKPRQERELVKRQRCPMDAWRAGQKYKRDPNLLVENYDKYALMERLCRAKLAQHEDVRAVLLATGNRELQKVHDTDYYWGTGADGSGENQMGRLWMQLREELQDAESESRALSTNTS
jgi:ribA/ribD-fused uncharacterized protein